MWTLLQYDLDLGEDGGAHSGILSACTCCYIISPRTKTIAYKTRFRFQSSRYYPKMCMHEWVCASIIRQPKENLQFEVLYGGWYISY